MRAAFTPKQKVKYWTGRPGQWQRGTFCAYEGAHQVKVQPSRTDLEPLTLPLRQVKALPARKMRQAVAGAIVALQVLRSRRAPRCAPAAPLAPVVVHVHRDRAPLFAVPKPARPWRCPRYRRAVGRLPCCNPFCPHHGRRRSDAHHVGQHGLSIKVPDSQLAPLCRGPGGCHRAVTDDGVLPGFSSRAETELFLRRIAAELIAAWLTQQDDQLAEIAVLPYAVGEGRAA